MSDLIPDGYAPWQPASPYMTHLNQLGAIYWRESDDAFGVRVTQAHGNNVGIAHGGFLATIADCVLGHVIVRQRGVAVVTVQLGVEYLNAVKEGDWLEARVRIDKPGKRLVHAACQLEVAGRMVLKANGVFAVIGPASPPSQAFDG
ncbi:PaaI family thioesterase [Achromobacter aloeverae]|uniref:PaaI family thioesterase n=1 Tax=Achromobacter aloeverae TaxID=1750518 RepID=A0A4Q1HS36_9BURK|nr:PaaI family thioesterase [Achromobacter aloeverae]RXN92805.1 PaaI family thioesterase [Achromobacter aloeverae]